MSILASPVNHLKKQFLLLEGGFLKMLDMTRTVDLMIV